MGSYTNGMWFSLTRSYCETGRLDFLFQFVKIITGRQQCLLFLL
jgi:hypothetical protein